MVREEAIKQIKSVLQELKSNLKGVALGERTQEAFETLIPELKESEDERTRKDIIAYFDGMRDKNLPNGMKQPVLDAWIAYLEKQESLISYYEEKLDRCACENLNKGIKEVLNHPEEYGLEKQEPEFPKPHKGDDSNPYDMSVSEAQEYAINRGFDFPFNDGEVFIDGRYMTQTVGNIIRWADEHQKEQKPAEWREKDDEIRKAVIAFLEMNTGYFACNGFTKYDIIQWLKSICPQPYTVSIKNANKFAELEYERGVKDSLNHHWKPSKEQIEALKSAQQIIYGHGLKREDVFAAIESLYNDLKKLT